MKKKQFKVALPAIAFSLAILAGCSKAPETQTPTSQPQSPAVTQQQKPSESVKPTDTKGLIAYYSQHLDEARQVWHECQAKGVNGLNDEEKEKCAIAQSAWETQPYRPGNRK